MEDALEHTQFLLQYSPLMSSKVNDFHFIWKGVLHFLLVINSNLGAISYRFRDVSVFVEKRTSFSTCLHSTQNLKMFSLH